MASVIDVDALISARETLIDTLAGALKDPLGARYHALASAAAGGLEGPAMAARSLRNACLDWHTRADGQASLARAQYAAAANMTERLGALRCLVRYDTPGKDEALRTFQERYLDDALVTDKWLSLVVSRPHIAVLDEVRALLKSPWWNPTNPNRVRAVLTTFARQNPTAFHRPDGEGYRFVAEQLPMLDKINSQVAARLLGSFESWRRLVGERKTLAREVLGSLQGQLASRECADLLGRLLGDDG